MTTSVHLSWFFIAADFPRLWWLWHYWWTGRMQETVMAVGALSFGCHVSVVSEREVKGAKVFTFVSSSSVVALGV
jgi:hypothetical protein